MSIRIIQGDCREVLPTLSGLDACVCDPPYALKFMGKAWDRDIALRPETWRLVFDAMKPGAHLVAFGGTRTCHRMACAIEDAGFEIRDTLAWVYGAGFPKSHDAERGIDVELCTLPGRHFQSNLPKPDKRKPDDHICPSCGAGDPWQGWGTALKPSFEPIALARRPLIGSVAANVLAHGTGAINVDACRIDAAGRPFRVSHGDAGNGIYGEGIHGSHAAGTTNTGRWPANLLHDGSDEVEAAFAAFGVTTSGAMKREVEAYAGENVTGFLRGRSGPGNQHGDSGTASRFFYSAKADADDRAWSKHPTVKPIALMRWLVRLITPPGGTVLDCFAGSGTTGEAAMLEGFNAVLIEREAEYVADIRRRLGRAHGADTPLFAVRAP